MYHSGLQIAILSLLLYSQPALAGTLDQLREDARADNEQQDRANSQRAEQQHDDHRVDDPQESSSIADLFFSDLFGTWLGHGFIHAFSSPIWLPRQVLGDNRLSQGYFLSYPYQQGEAGLMRINPLTPSELQSSSRTARFQYAEDFDRMLTLSGHFFLQGKHRWGLDAGFDYRREKITATSHDQLWTGSVDVVHRFAQSDRVQMYFGVGANFLADSIDTDWGVNFTYGADWMLEDPWIMSLDLDAGRVGQASLSHVRWTIGMAIRRYEVYIGFDRYRVGGTDLNQLVTGIRLWF
jgi:hypothetical protein